MDTYRLSCFDGHKSVVALFATHVAESPVVCNVLGDVRNFMNCMVVLKNLQYKPLY